MKKALLTSAVMTALAAGAAPAVADQTEGGFSYDRSTRTLYVLGDAYSMPESIGTIRLRNADQVSVTWYENGSGRVVQKYSAHRKDSAD